MKGDSQNAEYIDNPTLMDQKQHRRLINGTTRESEVSRGKMDKYNKINKPNKQREDDDAFQQNKANIPPEEVKKIPDGGWGWMVAIGCFLITSLIPMVGPCFGILFSRYLLSLGTSSTTTAWIFNSKCFIWNVMGLVTRPLTQEFGWRTIGVLGALLTSVSFTISAFSPYAEFLFFSFSLLCGVGGGSVVCICFTILPHYFDKHRGVANAMMMAGVCLGQILAPPLVQRLQEEYGFQGATMIVGAIILNGCIGASLFHPVKWHLKKAEGTQTQLQDGDTPLLPEKVPLKFTTEGGLKKSQSTKSFSEANVREIDWVEIITHARLLRMRGTRHLSDVSQLSLSSSVAVSTVDITSIGTGQIEADIVDEASVDDKDKENKSVCSLVLRVIRSTISDLRVLQSPRALIISLGATFCINGYINFVMMVPFAMQVAGHTLESSAWCISMSAICNLFTRLLVSSMSDWPRFSVKACYVSGFAVIFITTLVFPFLTSLRWMLVVMGVWGCGVGANMGVYNLVMISVMGLDNLAPVFGASSFMVAMGFITFGPVIGVVRDATESYNISMWMVTGMLFISLTLWSFMPAAIAYDKKKSKDSNLKAEQSA